MKIRNILLVLCILLLPAKALFAVDVGAGVPLDEYKSLVKIYNLTDGANWTDNTNWLDTTAHAVSEWYGVTVTGGHVTQLDLSSNNLQNSIFDDVVNLPEITSINISGNLLNTINFTNIEDLDNLSSLYIFGNNFIFEDIQPAFSAANFAGFAAGFAISPQNKIDTLRDIEVLTGLPALFEVSDDYISDGDNLQWYKNGAILAGENSKQLNIAATDNEDSGTYQLKITNLTVLNLTLESKDKKLTVVPPKGPGVPKAQYDALVEIYNDLDGSNWTDNTNWLDTTYHTVADWYGVTVDAGNVTQLSLSENKLSGDIPSSIEDLTELTVLNLGGNSIQNSIPAEIGTLSNLTNLYLKDNQVTGTIPTTIYDLTKLVVLNLSDNNLSGTISVEVEDFTNLEELYLDNNTFDGSIPSEIGNLTNLEALSLHNNNIDGTIPTEMGSLVNLVSLTINNNQITSSLPTQIGSITNLELFNASENLIEGAIPTTFGSLSHLKTIKLSDNKIVGPVPAELSNCTDLETIDLRNNLITYETPAVTGDALKSAVDETRQIPEDLAGLVNLDTLLISNNGLMFNDIEPVFSWGNYAGMEEYTYHPQDTIGEIQEVEKLVSQTVTLSIDNYVAGASDKYQWYKDNVALLGKNEATLELTNLQFTDAGKYHCIVTNSVATNLSLFGNYIKLELLAGAGVPVSEYEALVTFYNNLDGDNWSNNENWLDSINYNVDDWHGITVSNGHVTSINLTGKNLVGSIDPSISDLPMLELLYLSANGITGSIPATIGGLTNLEKLNLSNNALTSEILAEFGTLTKLEILNLAHNQVDGAIPAELGNLTLLKELELSDNQLTGPLPVELKNCTKLEVLKIDNNLLGAIDITPAADAEKSTTVDANRQIPDYLEDLTLLKELFIGQNSLQFNDIETIFGWTSYPGMTSFTYAPQDSIGTTKTIVKLKNQDLTITIDNYYPGSSDKYQWYKDGVQIVGATDATLDFTQLVTADEGNYYCKISNSLATDLVLCTRKITLDIIPIQGAGVPVTEYEALKQFYLNLDGANWLDNTNWLDTVNSSVTNWIGVSVVNNHVAGITLPNNNLNGDFPQALEGLTQLKVLNLDSNLVRGTIGSWIDKIENLQELSLAHNQITGEIQSDLGKIFSLRSLILNNNQFTGTIPSRIVNCKDLEEFRIDSNLYTTIHIEPIFGWSNFENFENNFVYAPQPDVGKIDTITKIWGDALEIDIEDYTPGTADQFTWFIDSVLIPGETGPKISIAQVTKADSGSYFCQITNTIATELTLSSKPVEVVVNGAVAGAGVPVAEYLALVEIYDTTNGAGWTNNENWLDTTFHSVNDWYGITVDNGHVQKFELPNNNLTHIPGQLTDLPELVSIDVSTGNFDGEIPYLGTLTKLSKFDVSNNKYYFKDLVPLTRWANSNTFKDDFVYAPQPYVVGSSADIVVQLSDSIILKVDNYEAENQDNFEWFKNSVSIKSSGENGFAKKAWIDDNNASFNCEITNINLPDLTYISRNVTTGVLYSSNDSLALAALKMNYDTLQKIWTGDSIFNWPLVTADKGTVTALDLSGLELDGAIYPAFVAFDSLTRLDLSKNNLKGAIPAIATAKSGTLKSAADLKLEYLNIANNNFVFADLEPLADELNSIAQFVYSPQPDVGEPFDTTIYKNKAVTFEIGNYTSGSSDVFTWFKDGVIVPAQIEETYKIESAELADSGYYTCSITNTLFPDLTLTADTSWLKVLIPVGVNDILQNNFKIYPNPASNRIFVDTNNETVDLKIYNIAGKAILERNEVQSEWIDISEYNQGIYLLRIFRKNGETIHRKVIFE